MIRQYDVYVSETSLYDTAKNRLVWSGTARTESPRDLDREMKRHVSIVIGALKSKNLLPSA